MSITLCTDDLPLGITATEAACLVLGVERVSNDILIVVHTETEHTYAWDRSMRERFANEPMPAFVRTCLGDDIAPDLSQQHSVSEAGPADCRSVDKSTAPLKPEHRGLEFADVQIKAQERGLNLTQTEHGYRLQNKHGAIVRKQLGELLEVINHSPKDGK